MMWDDRYRPLKEGEIITDGDEVLSDDSDMAVWLPTRAVGQFAPSPLYPAHRQYRRLKEAKP